MPYLTRHLDGRVFRAGSKVSQLERELKEILERTKDPFSAEYVSKLRELDQETFKERTEAEMEAVGLGKNIALKERIEAEMVAAGLRPDLKFLSPEEIMIRRLLKEERERRAGGRILGTTHRGKVKITSPKQIRYLEFAKIDHTHFSKTGKKSRHTF